MFIFFFRYCTRVVAYLLLLLAAVVGLPAYGIPTLIAAVLAYLYLRGGIWPPRRWRLVGIITAGAGFALMRVAPGGIAGPRLLIGGVIITFAGVFARVYLGYSSPDGLEDLYRRDAKNKARNQNRKTRNAQRAQVQRARRAQAAVNQQAQNQARQQQDAFAYQMQRQQDQLRNEMRHRDELLRREAHKTAASAVRRARGDWFV